MTNFAPGDIVVLKSGRAPLVVVEVDGNEVMCHYVSDPENNYGVRWRRASDYILHEPSTDKEAPMTKLYQTKTAPAEFGTLLAKNSDGHYVLEMKGATSDVRVFPPNDVEEVLPYTVRVVWSGLNGSARNYAVSKGAVEVGDLLLSTTDYNIGRVTEIDTKTPNPQGGTLRAVKLVTAPIAVN